MALTDIVKQAERFARSNSPAILTAFGATGAITTAVLTGRAAYKSYPIIKKHEETHGIPDTNREMYLERAKLVWRLYVPATVSGTTSVACIVLAARVGSRRTAAITAAYSLSEKAFNEYKDKVVETFGEKKEQKVRDDIAQDQVNKTSGNQLVVIPDGSVMCCELHTGRYFHTDMESLRKAENQINSQLMKHDYASLSDFYDLVGLPHTSNSGNLGWESGKLMELEISTVLSKDNKPCIAFDYNYVTL